ncbi:hypothetical protein LJ655_15610 [Paraburkholderia sp. MMS20-SJTN17]|uniref:Uncharacterized protein n=1 Tax=Paraburkholderia translucens TaxID=2886945 RepID=A0ABS8KF25_9BURK|nr:hypothetical protein [Paraburkholderia sp. MMS20-SJTN17]MCC8403300.1 hypothetical protein [Paraburkholderia sp. MMS20-SJTN17]
MPQFDGIFAEKNTSLSEMKIIRGKELQTMAPRPAIQQFKKEEMTVEYFKATTYGISTPGSG